MIKGLEHPILLEWEPKANILQRCCTLSEAVEGKGTQAVTESCRHSYLGAKCKCRLLCIAESIYFL